MTSTQSKQFKIKSMAVGTCNPGEGFGFRILLWPVLVLFFCLGMVSVAFADCSVTSLTTSAASAAQVGDSVVVTVTYSGTSCSGSQLYLDASAGLTADPAYRTLSSDSGSTTFSITAAVADTYTYNARLATSESTEASIEFVSPDVLTVTEDSTPETVTDQAKDSAFTLSIVVYNPSSANITTTYSYTYDSLLISISGGSSSGSVTVNAGDTTTLTRSVTPIDYFTGEDVSFNLGSNYGAFTTTVSTVSEPNQDNNDDDDDRTTTTTEETTPVTTAPQTPAQASENASASTTSSTGTSSSTSTGTTTPPTTGATVTRADAQSSLDVAGAAISQALAGGKDVKAARAKLTEAQSAFLQGDFVRAQTLAADALTLAQTATKPAGKPQTGTGAAGTSTTEGTGSKPVSKPFDWSLLFLVSGVLVVAVAICAVGAYLFLKRGKGGSGGTGGSSTGGSYKGKKYQKY